MAPVQRNEKKIASIGTVVIWLLIALLAFWMPSYSPKPKPIKITLDSPKQVQRETAPAAPAPAMPAPPPPAPAAAKPAAPAPSKTAPKSSPQPSKSVKPVPQPRPEPKLQKSVEEQMKEMQQKKNTKKEVNWDEMFADAEESTSQPSAPAATATKKVDALSGSSASSSSKGSGSVTSKSYDAKSSSASASSSTSSALSGIKDAKFSMADNGVSSETNVKSTNSNGKVSLAMSDGTARELLDPKKPVIFLSEEAALKIDATKTVTITFTVTADGRVPVNGIRITPASLLPTIVQNEVSQQISRWRFASASSDGTATFSYTIRKQ